MGSNSSSQLYTIEEIRQEANKSLLPTLPMAGLEGDVIKVQGASGLFRPDCLFDPKWLHGKMTIQEFTAIINEVNEGTMQAMVGMPKRFPSKDIPQRGATAAQGAQNAINSINTKWNSRGVYFKFTVGELKSEITDISGGGGTVSTTKKSSLPTFIFIRFE